ncbi:MAG: cation:proton antiporter [Acidimicrobiales bacterium]
MSELLIVAVAVFGFAMVSERFSMSPVTAPMVFTTIGIVVGTGGFGWFDLDLEGEAVSILVEATLVLVLFTDAIRIDLKVLRRQAIMPGRLLGIGLPLTIVAGTAAALVVVPDLGLAEAALLAAVLAPTDAALGQAVVSDQRLPVRIRQALNVESGLNDGIAVPVVTVLLAWAAAEGAGGAGDWVELAARQVGFGVAAGVAAGAVGGRILDSRSSVDAVEGVYRQLATIAVAVAAFGLAGVLDGNGFIAAFTAGLTFGQIARHQCSGVQDFTEDEGELLSAITFVIFGAVLVGPMLDELSWQTAIYAIASLTVIRIVPVLIAMIGSGTFLETRLFLGWFGPRGLASILFALVVVEELDSPAGRTIFTVAAWTVLASVFAHGLTANAWAGRLAHRLTIETDPMPENEPAAEMPTRRVLDIRPSTPGGTPARERSES